MGSDIALYCEVHLNPFCIIYIQDAFFQIVFSERFITVHMTFQHVP
jgi:hypothetical protein